MNSSNLPCNCLLRVVPTDQVIERMNADSNEEVIRLCYSYFIAVILRGVESPPEVALSYKRILGDITILPVNGTLIFGDMEGLPAPYIFVFIKRWLR